MKNYKDKFTPEQLAELHKYYDQYVIALKHNPAQKLEWTSPIGVIEDDALPFSDELFAIIDKLFAEEFKWPEDKKDLNIDSLDYFQWRTTFYYRFLDGIVYSLFSPTVIYDQDTYITTLTDNDNRKAIANKYEEVLLGQSRYEFDKEGNPYLVQEESNKFLPSVFDKTLLEVFLTSVFELSKRNANGAFLIPRKSLEHSLNIMIRKPTKDILDFIMANKDKLTKLTPAEIEKLTPEDQTKYEEALEAFNKNKELADNILQNYSFWVALLNLGKAGTIQTQTGIYSAINFNGYNEVADAIEVDSPALRHMYHEIKENTIKGELRNNKPSFEITQTTNVKRGSYYKASKNPATIEITDLIIQRIVTRGVKPDSQQVNKKVYQHTNKKRITIFIPYSQFVKDCPTLRQRFTTRKEYLKDEDGKPLKDEKGKDCVKYTPVTPGNKRTILNRAFFAADNKAGVAKKKGKTGKEIVPSIIEDVLRKHTVIFDKYSNFKITCEKISLKDLDHCGVTITHEGINSEYEERPLLHPPKVENLPD